PLRQFYDGDAEIGATLHWIAPGFDTGNILSQHARPLPATLNAATVFPVWGATMAAALEEGTRHAVAGDPGTPQDESRATYAGAFTEAESWLDWSLPVR